MLPPPTLWAWLSLDQEIRLRPEAPERKPRQVETGQKEVEIIKGSKAGWQKGVENRGEKGAKEAGELGPGCIMGNGEERGRSLACQR